MRYLRTKRDRMGHDLPGLGESSALEALLAETGADRGGDSVARESDER
jgi:hypothetical protein